MTIAQVSSLPTHHQDVLIFRPVHGKRIKINYYDSNFRAFSLAWLTISYNESVLWLNCFGFLYLVYFLYCVVIVKLPNIYRFVCASSRGGGALSWSFITMYTIITNKSVFHSAWLWLELMVVLCSYSPPNSFWVLLLIKIRLLWVLTHRPVRDYFPGENNWESRVVSVCAAFCANSHLRFPFPLSFPSCFPFPAFPVTQLTRLYMSTWWPRLFILRQIGILPQLTNSKFGMWPSNAFTTLCMHNRRWCEYNFVLVGRGTVARITN